MIVSGLGLEPSSPHYKFSAFPTLPKKLTFENPSAKDLLSNTESEK